MRLPCHSLYKSALNTTYDTIPHAKHQPFNLIRNLNSPPDPSGDIEGDGGTVSKRTAQTRSSSTVILSLIVDSCYKYLVLSMVLSSSPDLGLRWPSFSPGLDPMAISWGPPKNHRGSSSSKEIRHLICESQARSKERTRTRKARTLEDRGPCFSEPTHGHSCRS